MASEPNLGAPAKLLIVSSQLLTKFLSKQMGVVGSLAKYS